MLDRDVEHRLTELETQMAERSQTASGFRAEIRVVLETITGQQLAVGKELGKLTAAFEAHLAEDRRVLTKLNGNHQHEKLINTGMGVGFGAGMATVLVAILKALGLL